MVTNDRLRVLIETTLSLELDVEDFLTFSELEPGQRNDLKTEIAGLRELREIFQELQARRGDDDE